MKEYYVIVKIEMVGLITKYSWLESNRYEGFSIYVERARQIKTYSEAEKEAQDFNEKFKDTPEITFHIWKITFVL